MTGRSEFTAGLRQVAGFLDDHPEVPLPYLGGGTDSKLPTLMIFPLEDQRAVMGAVARAMGHATKAPKTYSDGTELFQVWRDFAGITLCAQADRNAVCTRVVTGTEEREVEEVVTPAVKRKVVKQVDVVEWKCQPLLADAAAGGA
jgi:hypothetical protein